MWSHFIYNKSKFKYRVWVKLWIFGDQNFLIAQYKTLDESS